MASWSDGIEGTRLLIAPLAHTSFGKEINIEIGESQILSLRHPKSGSPTCYIYKNDSLHELHWFKQAYGSWFLGDYVCEDGSLYISTPVDPVFILLPIFEEARMKKGNDVGMFRQLDEIIFIDGFPGYQHLSNIAEGCMKLICDVKGYYNVDHIRFFFSEIGTSKFFRLDDSKVNNLKQTLTTLDRNYAAREEKETYSIITNLCAAVGTVIEIVSLLGEYLKDEPWLMLLCRHLELNIEETIKKSSNENIHRALENTPLVSHPLTGKDTNGTSASSSGKQSKKLKITEKSQNIKDMFFRASRRGK
ncbi:hypothetical protein QJS04_geneDACA004327 [Acorus gramineus]|uniref:Rnh202 triple barrel domain-containing protein n=1 Tax=Acorus gramineus TaxID=55184 RepID=A0AAV9B097_ACOGR|nr:hypothetical protein QJS04_geneDACA004327 [Acorus gramineus]